MKMTTILLAAAATASGALPVAAETIRFTRDGVQYVADVSNNGATTVLKGKNLSDNSRFNLRVAGERVTGTVDGRPVSFRAPQAKGEHLAAR